MGAVRLHPVTPALLAERLADRIADLRPADGGSRVCAAVDGAPAARPEALADALVEPLRLRGRHVRRIRTADFLRPASLRLEHGHRDPDSFYDL